MDIKKTIVVLCVASFLAGVCFVCKNSGLSIWEKSERPEEEISSSSGNYSTDFSSIIESIENNSAVVFNSLDNELLSFELPDIYPPIAWTQADYLAVTNEFFQQMGGNVLYDNTLVRTIQFNSQCEDVDLGLQDMRVTLYQTGTMDGESTRINVGLYIFPKKGLISWSEAEYFPDLTRQATINLGDIQISAEQALEIAETNGGKHARELLNNVCDVKLALVGGMRSNDWSVNYTNAKYESIFYIRIDEVTGKYVFDS